MNPSMHIKYWLVRLGFRVVSCDLVDRSFVYRREGLSPQSSASVDPGWIHIPSPTAATGGVPGAAAALGCSRRRIPKRARRRPPRSRLSRWTL